MIRVIGAIIAVLLAVAGAVALVFYVQGADSRAAEGAEFEKVYVVKAEVPEGTPGEAIETSIEVQELPAISINPDIVTNLADIEGLVTNADLVVGEQLLNARFSDPADLVEDGEVAVPEGMQEVTVALSVDRVVGGTVKAGSTVGVVLSTNTTSIAANDQTAQTQFVYHRVLVTGVTLGNTFVAKGAPSDSDEDQSFDTIMVTLAVTTPQVEKLSLIHI